MSDDQTPIDESPFTTGLESVDEHESEKLPGLLDVHWLFANQQVELKASPDYRRNERRRRRKPNHQPEGDR